MPAAAKAKTSRKASEIEPKVAAKSGSKKQKVVEEVVEESSDDEEEEAVADEDEASDDDDEEEEAEDEEEEEKAAPEEEAEEEEAEGAFKDETLECKDCGNEFVFTSGEQEFYQQKVRYEVKSIQDMRDICTLNFIRQKSCYSFITFCMCILGFR